MTDKTQHSTVEVQREQIANTFNRENDPLATHAEKFDRLEVDPFDLYKLDVLNGEGLAPATVDEYERVFDQWRKFMDEKDRHFACPNEHHVKEFARKYRDEKDNRPDTVEKKLLRLNKAYEYWQSDPTFPHPSDYNPFSLAILKLNFEKPIIKDPPKILLDELRDILADITHIRDRAIILCQLKLGLRAGEICNLQIQDINIVNGELEEFYSDIGSHWMVEKYENAIYIAPKSKTNLPVEGRSKNKSRRPRVLPLDRELQQALLRYLLVRPDADSPWLFLSKQKHTKLENGGVNQLWKDVFHPKYAEAEDHRGVTSHFGRHYFTSHWRVEEDLNRDLIKYMRGDTTGNVSLESRGAIDDYIHTYYEDIEQLYRDRIFYVSYY